ncbi:MAG: PAS domain S-box protein [Chloroflexi bacterium]|nr:PAS domain S-box protein [Chloroflexota bacterium]
MALGLGLVVLAGWAFSAYSLTSFLPGTLPTKANAAVLLALTGAAIVVHATGRGKRFVGLLAAVVGLVVIVTAIEYVARVDLGVDNLLFKDVAAQGAPYPGRMAIVSVVGFGASAGALLLLGRTWRGIHPSEVLALVAGSVGALGVLGYAYGAAQLTSIGSDTRIAFPTSLGFIALASAIVASDAEHGLTRLLRDPHLSGRLARRLVVVVILVLPVAGMLAINFGQPVSRNAASAIATLVVLELVTFVIVGGWIIEGTRRVEGASAGLAEALAISERRFREALSDVSVAAVMLDREGTVIFANRYLLDLMGRPPAEIIGQDWFETVSQRPDPGARRRGPAGRLVERVPPR